MHPRARPTAAWCRSRWSRRSLPEFYPGGGGLYSTGRDYLAFLQMLLHGGSFNGARVLKPETVAFMAKNQIGETPAGILKTESPPLERRGLLPRRAGTLESRPHVQPAPGRMAGAPAR